MQDDLGTQKAKERMQERKEREQRDLDRLEKEINRKAEVRRQEEARRKAVEEEGAATTADLTMKCGHCEETCDVYLLRYCEKCDSYVHKAEPCRSCPAAGRKEQAEARQAMHFVL